MTLGHHSRKGGNLVNNPYLILLAVARIEEEPILKGFILVIQTFKNDRIPLRVFTTRP